MVIRRPRGCLTNLLGLLIICGAVVYAVVAITSPWAFHIGGRWTPLLYWSGRGKLVTKNGILIVEFANQRKGKGMAVREAVLSSAVARFRPILMTSLSTVLGILPIALGLGAGAESRTSMGIAVVGGMILSSGLTLYVIPSIYSVFSKETGSRTER